MRRRSEATDVRSSLSAWFGNLSKLYGGDGDGDELAKLAQALDAGEPVVVHAFEVDGMGVHGLVRVEPDGQVVPVEWDPVSRAYVVLS